MYSSPQEEQQSQATPVIRPFNLEWQAVSSSQESLGNRWPAHTQMFSGRDNGSWNIAKVWPIKDLISRVWFRSVEAKINKDDLVNLHGKLWELVLNLKRIMGYEDEGIMRIASAFSMTQGCMLENMVYVLEESYNLFGSVDWLPDITTVEEFRLGILDAFDSMYPEQALLDFIESKVCELVKPVKELFNMNL